jgi:nitrite reductase (NADH) large subunit
METANRQVSIQDTNDRFLANIQRNGTYSVVPRVPGGEITPDKLIALGETAKKYDLYTKITGGQRIDLFGAQLHELPLIWKDLIDAGFESGHAYGKALRTVKSCVGSTWCRYGMHESVTFAIEIENRYKGLRSPHKLKGGVSGCIRECAEARGKDFGLIAVEGGWNLYVCGNGGATPKHAVLFAEKLDDATCIKYLDRFLMYYIRTAGPLVRTAPWLEKLEGGIEYLKQVIIEDSLGIADELEKEMQGLVNKYECEWKQAIEDPNMSKRFRHFVNSEDTDDNLVFVPMRDQKKPKAWI